MTDKERRTISSTGSTRTTRNLSLDRFEQEVADEIGIGRNRTQTSGRQTTGSTQTGSNDRSSGSNQTGSSTTTSAQRDTERR